MHPSTFDFKQARENMVENQLRPAEVNHQLLIEIMRALPREKCLTTSYSEIAYSDISLPLGKGRMLSEPRVMARMLQLADLKPDQKVMLIGGVTGYMASIISLLGAEVIAVESDDKLLKMGQQFTNTYAPKVIWHHGDLADGCVQYADYDIIIIDGAIITIPESLKTQLKQHGYLITVLCEDGTAPTAVRLEKIDHDFIKFYSFYADLPLLNGFL